jgi:GNAT superfamily N-acetyltransferase
MEDVQVVFDPLPPDALRQFITESLANFNVARTGSDPWYPVGFFLKGARGDWQGGLLGEIWGGWLHVRNLWLAEAARGQRNGSRLMDAAEKYAVERGCFAAMLDTHSFQALGFYQKRGYAIFGTLEDFPPGHTRHFLRKRLGQL